MRGNKEGTLSVLRFTLARPHLPILILAPLLFTNDLRLMCYVLRVGWYVVRFTCWVIRVMCYVLCFTCWVLGVT